MNFQLRQKYVFPANYSDMKPEDEHEWRRACQVVIEDMVKHLGLDLNMISSLISKSEDKAADYTITDKDGNCFNVTSGSGADITITLPTAADNVGREIVVRKADAGSADVIVAAEGTELIEGASSGTISTQYDYIRVKCVNDVTNSCHWAVI